MKTIAIFGSTGSIGKNAIDVIKGNPHKFLVKILVAKNDVKTLINQALELNPEFVVIENLQHYAVLKSALKNLRCNVLAGWDAILEISKIKCDLMLSAIVGSAGMLPTLNAIRAGTNIALANKESMVCAGGFLNNEAEINNVKIIPVDSEHNAIFQVFENDNLANINNIILTASGGPFFNANKDFSKIKVSEALKHPNWQMGAKISIDSATMMNKGLELIEAYYLFPLAKNQIQILVHPQSIIHGIVNYQDGSTLAMMSIPDMRVPISFALHYPRREKISYQQLDLIKLQKLEFFAVDENKFPAIKICQQALEVEGNAPVILNASNEVAVEKFLNSEISFDKIPQIVLETLNQIPFKKLESIDDVLFNDSLAREFAKKLY